MTLSPPMFWTLAGLALVALVLAMSVVKLRTTSLSEFRRRLRPEHDEPGAVDRETLVLLAASGGGRRLSVLLLVLSASLAGCESEPERVERVRVGREREMRECIATCPRGLAPALLPSGQYGYPGCACLPPGAQP